MSNILQMKREDPGAFLKISGDKDGHGPFELSWDKVSPQMVLVLEECLAGIREELTTMIQNDNGGEE